MMKRYFYLILLIVGMGRNAGAQTPSLREAMLYTPSFFERMELEEQSFSLPTQTVPYKRPWIKTHLIGASGCFLSGACDGVSQALYAHYGTFEKKFPNANKQYWDPDVSSMNKYEDGNPLLGPAYFLSTSLLVGGTSGYYLFRTLSCVSLMGSSGYVVAMNMQGQKKWKAYVVDFFINALAFGAGFTAVYNVYFAE